ncbi:MAG: antibiotic biosynthesis monooxygenase [Bacteroidetes bacterium]|nr:antibiotic biosynthesis monooxygenase [Bacteroidota bacterium]
MIIRIVKLSIVPDQISRFKAEFDLVSGLIRNFRGCSHLELLEDINVPGLVFTYSYWDEEKSLQDYQSSELFKSTWSKVKSMFNAKAEAWSLTGVRQL